MGEAFHYEVGWLAPGRYPGHHRSLSTGPGFEVRGHASLLSAPDARRVDLRASLRDPFGQWIVRTYRQRSAIEMYVLADLSASMGFVGAHRKLDILAAFTASAAYSAYRTGDAFGFIGVDEEVRKDFFVPATRIAGAGAALGAKLCSFEPDRTSSAALPHAGSWLPRRRCLVFLVSDFHIPQPLLTAALDVLARHHVVPVVIWDRAESSPTPRFGLSVVRDSESARRRTLLLRPALRRKLAAAFRERRASLHQLFTSRGMRALFIRNDFHPEAVTRYFLGSPAESKAEGT